MPFQFVDRMVIVGTSKTTGRLSLSATIRSLLLCSRRSRRRLHTGFVTPMIQDANGACRPLSSIVAPLGELVLEAVTGVWFTAQEPWSVTWYGELKNAAPTAPPGVFRSLQGPPGAPGGSSLADYSPGRERCRRCHSRAALRLCSRAVSGSIPRGGDAGPKSGMEPGDCQRA